MKRVYLAAGLVAGLAFTGAAFAQSSGDTMKHDTMTHSGMKHDTMAHSGMKHDTMAHSGMKHDTMSHGTGSDTMSHTTNQ